MTEQQSATEAIKARLRTLTGPARTGGAKDMADLLGYPLANVTRYVHGAVVPPHDFLRHVADRYNVSLDWLYGRSESGGVDDAQAQEPAWARRLDARLRFLQRQGAEHPDWASRYATRAEITELIGAAEGRVTEAIQTGPAGELLVDRFVDRMLANPRIRALLLGDTDALARLGSGE